MDELQFCEHWCGKLTSEQEGMLMHCLNNDAFIGVGREASSTKWYPVVFTDGYKNRLYCINDHVYYVLASKEGLKRYVKGKLW